MAATDRELGELHQILTMHFAEILTGAVKDEDGNVIPVPAAVLGTIVAFLKNNNITASATTNAQLSRLTSLLAKKSEKMNRKSLAAAAEAYAHATGDLSGLPN